MYPNVVYFYRRPDSRSDIINNYPPLATDVDTEANSCFGIYLKSEIIITPQKINLDDIFACHGCKLRCHFFLSCLVVNGKGYLKFD